MNPVSEGIRVSGVRVAPPYQRGDWKTRFLLLGWTAPFLESHPSPDADKGQNRDERKCHNPIRSVRFRAGGTDLNTELIQMYLEEVHIRLLRC